MGKNNYNLYEEDEEYGFYSSKIYDNEYKKERKKKNKNKGHQSKHQSRSRKWDDIENDYFSDLMEELRSEKRTDDIIYNNKNDRNKERNVVTSITNSTATVGTQSSGFTFGPNSHEIKGNMIDFDRVIDIQKVENEHNGKNTFGIKFLFLGKKGLYRIAWFNFNEKERDKVYEIEKKYWMNLESYLNRS